MYTFVIVIYGQLQAETEEQATREVYNRQGEMENIFGGNFKIGTIEIEVPPTLK